MKYFGRSSYDWRASFNNHYDGRGEADVFIQLEWRWKLVAGWLAVVVLG